MTDQKLSELPQHVGIIVDGNRRWARENGRLSTEGHKQGVETLKRILSLAYKRGVKYLSVYAFSKENWKRTEDEVSFLMSLILKVFDRDLEKLHKDGIKVIILGSRNGLSPKVIQAIDKAEELTANNLDGVLAICLNYSGQQELTDAVKIIMQSSISPLEVSTETISQNLYHPELPPIDLLIRTSGEKRLSNFMLWRAAYAELYFTDTYWPDFDEAEFNAALKEYATRQRRFGE